MRISIQPLGDVDKRLIFSLEKELKRRFRAEVHVLNPTAPARECLNSLRGQFNSTCLLKRLTPSRITLGVVDLDIYAEGLNFVFGEAELFGKRAVVSVYRLKSNDSRLTAERLVKEAVHEIGHVLGLRHCKNRNCVMSFSNNIFDVDRKGSEFCRNCAMQIKNYLKSEK
ncbi:archaemetzincin family Zn-dependent metalloprotease [Archaeoglobus neptunius]|uniref:archaemetzincin family Zn-dependent metalloprotease n=1 Tax=Archaeoglobus neptunius TaxID=2798580 RepID=UPI001928A069|nr:archaemetzincin family Zn-dependent metalloprotease [Archaeoglobus neptunius]